MSSIILFVTRDNLITIYKTKGRWEGQRRLLRQVTGKRCQVCWGGILRWWQAKGEGSPVRKQGSHPEGSRRCRYCWNQKDREPWKVPQGFLWSLEGSISPPNCILNISRWWICIGWWVYVYVVLTCCISLFPSPSIALVPLKHSNINMWDKTRVSWNYIFCKIVRSAHKKEIIMCVLYIYISAVIRR